MKLFGLPTVFCVSAMSFILSGCGDLETKTKPTGTGTPVEVSEMKPAKTDGKQSVVIHLKLSNSKFGTKEEIAAMGALETQLQKIVADAKVGKLDGNEIGQGEYEIFIYGPDADKLFDVVKPTLNKSPLTNGATVVKQHGGEGAPEDKVVLTYPAQ